MNKRGAAAVLAMIFLVVFGALSFAFYAVINTSIAVARNDRDAVHARAAAESGMEFIKHVISWTKIKGTTPEINHLGEVQTTLEAMSNTWATELDSRTIRVPAAGMMPLHTGNHQFEATITEDWQDSPMLLRVNVTGMDSGSGLTRSISAMFAPIDIGGGVFKYSCATPGGIYISGGSILAGRGLMSGTIFPNAMVLLNPTLSAEELAVTVTESQVYPDTYWDKTTVVSPPTFPDFDTRPFLPFAVNSYDSVKNSSVWRNVRIRTTDVPGGKVLKVQGNTTIEGILYVDAGLSIDMGGTPTLKGVIVCEQNPSSPTAIAISGNFTTIKDTTGMDPELVKLTKGLTILAPTADISLSGSSGLRTEGSIICRRFIATSSGGGNEAIVITNGTLLALHSASMSRSGDQAALYISNRTVTFNVTGDFEFPSAGLVFKKQYVMLPDTYMEN